MPRSKPGLSVRQYHDLLRQWGFVQERSARGGGHSRWRHVPTGTIITSLNDTGSDKRGVTFVIASQATTILGVDLNTFKAGPPKARKAVACATTEDSVEVHLCLTWSEACLCHKGTTHDGEHLCSCGRSWK